MPIHSRRARRAKRRRLSRPQARIAAAAISVEQDAALTAAARRDPDNPPIDDATLASLRPAKDVLPQIVRRYRGPQKKPKKKLVSLRLDPDVIEFYKRTGPGWQARINAKLREPLERAGRRVQKRRVAR